MVVTCWIVAFLPNVNHKYRGIAPSYICTMLRTTIVTVHTLNRDKTNITVKRKT